MRCFRIVLNVNTCKINCKAKTSPDSGCDKLRKSVLTESAKRMSGFVSPFVSQLAKRSLAGGEKSLTSPVRGVASVRRASLFDDDED